MLLKATEKVYGLMAGFVRCLVNRREPGKVRHTLADLLGQRIFDIACGHPDGNDAEHLADDPLHKLLLGGAPGESPRQRCSAPLMVRILARTGLRHRWPCAAIFRVNGFGVPANCTAPGFLDTRLRYAA